MELLKFWNHMERRRHPFPLPPHSHSHSQLTQTVLHESSGFYYIEASSTDHCRPSHLLPATQSPTPILLKRSCTSLSSITEACSTNQYSHSHSPSHMMQLVEAIRNLHIPVMLVFCGLLAIPVSKRNTGAINESIIRCTVFHTTSSTQGSAGAEIGIAIDTSNVKPSFSIVSFTEDDHTEGLMQLKGEGHFGRIPRSKWTSSTTTGIQTFKHETGESQFYPSLFSDNTVAHIPFTPGSTSKLMCVVLSACEQVRDDYLVANQCGGHDEHKASKVFSSQCHAASSRKSEFSVEKVSSMIDVVDNGAEHEQFASDSDATDTVQSEQRETRENNQSFKSQDLKVTEKGNIDSTFGIYGMSKFRLDFFAFDIIYLLVCLTMFLITCRRKDKFVSISASVAEDLLMSFRRWASFAGALSLVTKVVLCLTIEPGRWITLVQMVEHSTFVFLFGLLAARVSGYRRTDYVPLVLMLRFVWAFFPSFGVFFIVTASTTGTVLQGSQWWAWFVTLTKMFGAYLTLSSIVVSSLHIWFGTYTDEERFRVRCCLILWGIGAFVLWLASTIWFRLALKGVDCSPSVLTLANSWPFVASSFSPSTMCYSIGAAKTISSAGFFILWNLTQLTTLWGIVCIVLVWRFPRLLHIFGVRV